MAAVGAGEAAAFRALAKRYHRRLLLFCHSYAQQLDDAQDLAQDTWLEVYNRAARYQPQQKFPHWLFTIAKHSCLNFLRDRHRALGTVALAWPLELAAVVSRPADDPLDLLIQAQLLESVQAGVRQLDDVERQILLSYVVDHKTLREIAAATALPITTLYDRISKLYQQLRRNT